MGAKGSKEFDELVKEKQNGTGVGASENNDVFAKGKLSLEEKQKQQKLNKKKPTAQVDVNNNINRGATPDLPPYYTTMNPHMANLMYSTVRSTPPQYFYTTKNPSRLHVDNNNNNNMDPLLLSTLPPHLTSVFNINDKAPIPQNNTEDLNATIDAAWRNLNKSNRPTKSLMLQELLECPICMNRYEDPHVLPCQHTYCKTCIVTLKGNSRNVDKDCICCPICRETHNLANGGVDSLPANYTMKRLIELEAMSAAEKEAKEAQEKARQLEKQQKQQHRHNRHRHHRHRHDRDDRDNYSRHSPRPIPKTSESSFSSVQSSNRYESKYQSHNQEIIYSKAKSDSNHDNSRIKIILLCHSSAIDDDSFSDKRSLHPNLNETFYEDEYGRCKTFSKIGVMIYDRVEMLKDIVEEKFQIPYDEQLLVYKDKILRNDTKQLGNYHLRNYSRVHVFDKRDVKENLSEFYDETNQRDGPYHIDEEFFKELTCISHQQQQQQNNKRNDQQQRPASRHSNYSRHNNYEHLQANGNRYNSVNRKDTALSNGRRVRKLNELFDNQMSVA